MNYSSRQGGTGQGRRGRDMTKAADDSNTRRGADGQEEEVGKRAGGGHGGS